METFYEQILCVKLLEVFFIFLLSHIFYTTAKGEEI